MHDKRRTKQNVTRSSQTTWATREKQNLQYDTSPVQGKIKQEKQQQSGIDLVLQYIMRWQNAATQPFRCDLNSFSLHRQRCPSTEAVQMSGKIYKYLYVYIYMCFNYAEVTSLGVIKEILTASFLHCTSLQGNKKVSKEKHHGTIVVHPDRLPFVRVRFPLLHATDLKSTTVVLHRCHLQKKISSHSNKVKCKTSL